MNDMKEVVIELSQRLADESDYEDNLQSKLQKLLDYLNTERK